MLAHLGDPEDAKTGTAAYQRCDGLQMQPCGLEYGIQTGSHSYMGF